jgi:hypothetical protein
MKIFGGGFHELRGQEVSISSKNHMLMYWILPIDASWESVLIFTQTIFYRDYLEVSYLFGRSSNCFWARASYYHQHLS